MCFGSTPKLPTVAEPTRPQETKQPESNAYGSTSSASRAMTASSPAASALLTGPSGVQNEQLKLGQTQLLGR